MKYKRTGFSRAIDKDTLKLLIKNSKLAKYKLLWNFLYYTGARIGAAIQINKIDCFDRAGLPLDRIKFSSKILKRYPSSKLPVPLIVPVAKPLKIALIELRDPKNLGSFLFCGENYHHHLSYSSAEYQFQKSISRANLCHLGYSLHGFKRGFIQRLIKSGATKSDITKLTGNNSWESIQKYLEVEENKIEYLINQIS